MPTPSSLVAQARGRVEECKENVKSISATLEKADTEIDEANKEATDARLAFLIAETNANGAISTFEQALANAKSLWCKQKETLAMLNDCVGDPHDLKRASRVAIDKSLRCKRDETLAMLNDCVGDPYDLRRASRVAIKATRDAYSCVEGHHTSRIAADKIVLTAKQTFESAEKKVESARKKLKTVQENLKTAHENLKTAQENLKTARENLKTVQTNSELKPDVGKPNAGQGKRKNRNSQKDKKDENAKRTRRSARLINLQSRRGMFS